MHGTYLQPYVYLTFNFNEDTKNFQLIGVRFEDMMNMICEPYNRKIVATYDYGEWRFNTYVFDVITEELFLSEDFFDKKSNKYYVRFLKNQVEELQSFFFRPPKKDIFLNSVSHRIFYELFYPTETPSTRDVTP